MWGKLRHFMCIGFLGLCMGSLWLFAASANIPTIPPWPAEEHKAARLDHASYQTEARVDHDYYYDVDVDDTTAAAAAYDDEECECTRRST